MGLRFRKSVSICKGVKVNLSKSGASLSLGGKGLTLNLGGNGARITAGIPGTGVSYSKKIGGGRKKESSKSVAKSKGLKPLSDGPAKTDKTQNEENIDEIVRASVEENDRFIGIYKLSPTVDTPSEFAARIQGTPDAIAKGLMDGDEDVVCDAFDEWIGDLELPVEIGINYQWNPYDEIMYLDVDLPEIEDVPVMEMTKTDAGKLKEKKKTQAELREDYATLVFGVAIFVAANTFNISPKIRHILFSAYTQRRDKNGDLRDDYIYSIRFERDGFEGVDPTVEDPKDFCMRFMNRCNMTQTGIFKAIEPYEPEPSEALMPESIVEYK